MLTIQKPSYKSISRHVSPPIPRSRHPLNSNSQDTHDLRPYFQKAFLAVFQKSTGWLRLMMVSPLLSCSAPALLKEAGRRGPCRPRPGAAAGPGGGVGGRGKPWEEKALKGMRMMEEEEGAPPMGMGMGSHGKTPSRRGKHGGGELPLLQSRWWCTASAEEVRPMSSRERNGLDAAEGASICSAISLGFIAALEAKFWNIYDWELLWRRPPAESEVVPASEEDINTTSCFPITSSFSFLKSERIIFNYYEVQEGPEKPRETEIKEMIVEKRAKAAACSRTGEAEEAEDLLPWYLFRPLYG